MKKIPVILGIIGVMLLVFGVLTMRSADGQTESDPSFDCATQGNRVCGPVVVWQYHPSETYVGLDCRGVPIRYTRTEINNNHLALIYYSTTMAVVPVGEVKHVGAERGWGETLRAQPPRCSR